MVTGIYQHFKGGLYIVEGVGKHSETQEEMVVYRNDEGDFWVRPASMFLETVDKDGYEGPRFKLLLKVEFGKVRPSDLLKKLNNDIHTA
jgi:hypothetical protein